MKTESRHDANFIVTGSTVGHDAHFVNTGCTHHRLPYRQSPYHQWRQSWHHDNYWYLVQSYYQGAIETLNLESDHENIDMIVLTANTVIIAMLIRIGIIMLIISFYDYIVVWWRKSSPSHQACVPGCHNSVIIMLDKIRVMENMCPTEGIWISRRINSIILSSLTGMTTRTCAHACVH